MADRKLNISIQAKDSASKALKTTKIGMDSLWKASKNAASSIDGLYGKLTAVASLLAGGALFGRAIQTFASFDDTMRQVGAVTGATTEELALLSETAKKMGRETRFSATQAAEGLTILGMSGFSTANAIAALPNVLNLAAAASIELSTAADIATNVLAAYGLGVDRLNRVNDILIKTSTSATVTVNELGESFKFVGPIAKAVGADFEDLFAAIGSLGDVGIRGSEAGTALRGALNALLNPTAQQIKLMDSLQKRLGGVAFQVKDAEGNFVGFTRVIEQLEKAGLRGDEAMRLFGQEAGPAMAALIGKGTDAITELRDKIIDAGGVTDRIAAEMEAGIGGSMREASAAFESVQIAIGEAFNEESIDAIDAVRDVLLDLSQAVKELDEEGSIKAWADAAKVGFDLAKKAALGLYWVLNDLVRVSIGVGAAMTGQLGMAEEAFKDIGKEAKKYFDEIEKGTNTYYKIDQATGQVIGSITEYRREIQQTSRELEDEGPIGRGAQKLIDAVNKVKIIDPVSTIAELRASLIKIKATLDLEAQSIESQYSKGLINLDEYFNARKRIVEQGIQAELALLREQAASTTDVDKQALINAKIYSLQQSLNADLIKLDLDKYNAIKDLEKKRLREDQNINNLRIAAEKVANDQLKRITEDPESKAEIEVQELELKHQTELSKIKDFYNAQIALLQQRNASEKEILSSQEAFKRALNEQTVNQKIELDKLLQNQETKSTILRIQQAQTIASTTSNIFSNLYTLLGRKSKEFFYLAQAASLAEATMNVAQGVTKALAQGGVFGILSGISVATAGAVQIAKIASQSLAQGGVVQGKSPSPTSDDKLIAATSGEFMQPVSSVNYYGKGVMEAIRRKSIPRELFSGFSAPTFKSASSNFATGGAVSNAISNLNNMNGNGREEPTQNIINVLDPSVFDQWSASTPGQRSVLNTISENIFQVRQMVFDNQQ